MSVPIVSIIGRPNVGKSTLYNRLAQTKDAIVHEQRGVTRDRSYHECEWNGHTFMLVDTGGIEMPASETDSFSAYIREAACQAIEESDAILFLVDGTTIPTEEDAYIAKLLAKSNKLVFLLVNKMDTPGNESAIYEWYSLGLGTPYAVSAMHGYGTGDLLDELTNVLPQSAEEAPQENVCNIAIVGRPNVGKSTLLNQLSKKQRSVVSDIAGTTRDAIDIEIAHDSNIYRFVDTAGIKRRAKSSAALDYYSYVRSLRAIDDADICLMLIDASEGMVEQDAKIIEEVIDKGCGLILLINKCDVLTGADEEEKAHLLLSLDRRTLGCKWAPVQKISALTGRKTQKIWKLIEQVRENRSRRISTAALNNWIQKIREAGYVPVSQKAQLKIRYATQVSTEPPAFAFFCNHPALANDNFKRYLEKKLRDSFDFSGTPLRLFFRGTKEV